MKTSAPTPPQAPAPPAPVQPDPALEAIKAQAATDKQDAIGQRVTARTNDLLLRYGARSAFSGTSAARVGL